MTTSTPRTSLHGSDAADAEWAAPLSRPAGSGPDGPSPPSAAPGLTSDGWPPERRRVAEGRSPAVTTPPSGASR